MKKIFNLLGSLMLTGVAVSSATAFASPLQKKLTTATANSAVQNDYYKFHNNYDPDWPHNNFAYTVGIGLNTLDNFVGKDYTFMTFQFEFFTHKGGSFGHDNPDNTLAAQWLLYYVLTGIGVIVTNPFWTPYEYATTMYHKMNGMEARIYELQVDRWILAGTGQDIDDFGNAYNEHKGLLFTFETWYTDSSHYHMAGGIIHGTKLVDEWPE